MNNMRNDKSNRSIKILGVDPGSQNLGYGVIELKDTEIKYIDHGVLKVRAERSFNERILELGKNFSAIVGRHRPLWVSVEKIFLAKNADSAFKLGHIRGVCIFESLKKGARIAEYSTREIKKGVTGKGSAEKEQVACLLEAEFELPTGALNSSLDASDAVAVAYYHAQKLLLGQRLAELDLAP